MPVPTSRILTMLASCLVGLGCLPFPVSRDGLATPDVVVSVTDGSHAPLQGVDVVLRRAETAPGPVRELTRQIVTTDASGRARFAKTPTTDTIMPLMMHGVPELSFHVCAEYGGASQVQRLKARPSDPLAPVEHVTLTLDPNQPTCTW